MNRNLALAVIAVLVLAVGVLGTLYYQQRQREGRPPELPADHPLIRLAAELTGTSPQTAPYGTDASELSALAPCVVLGPGDIGLAHRPGEHVPLAELAAAVPLFRLLAERMAAG